MSTSAFKQQNILLFIEIDRFRRSYCCRLSFTFSSYESLLNYSDVRAPPVFMCWFMCLFVLRLMFLSAHEQEIKAVLQKLGAFWRNMAAVTSSRWILHTGGGFKIISIKFKIICKALFTMQSLQSKFKGN